MNGDLIKFYQPFILGEAMFYENRVQIFHIGKTDQLINSSIVSYVAFKGGIYFTPLPGSHTEHCDIEHICFISIDL